MKLINKIKGFTLIVAVLVRVALLELFVRLGMLADKLKLDRLSDGFLWISCRFLECGYLMAAKLVRLGMFDEGNFSEIKSNLWLLKVSGYINIDI